MNTEKSDQLQRDYDELENLLDELRDRLSEQQARTHSNAGIVAALKAAAAIADDAAHDVAIEFDREEER